MKKISTRERIKKACEALTTEQRGNSEFDYYLSTDRNRINKGDWSLIEDFLFSIFNHLYRHKQLRIKPLVCVFGPKEIVDKWNKKRQFIDGFVALDNQDHQEK